MRAWQQRAETDLFRSKRCLALAELLTARAALDAFLYLDPSRAGLAQALEDPGGRRAIAGVVRRAKAEAIGTQMADLTVCGGMALTGAGFGQSPRLVNLAGLFQRASIITGFAWLTTPSAQALPRARSTTARRHGRGFLYPVDRTSYTHYWTPAASS